MLIKYMDGDISTADITIFGKKTVSSRTFLNLVMDPQIRNGLLPVVKSTILLREFKGTKSLDGLKLFIDICYICDCLLIGAVDVFMHHLRLRHHKLDDGTNIHINFNAHSSSSHRGLDLCLYNATSSKDADSHTRNIFAAWHGTSVPGNHGRIKYIYHNPIGGKSEHGCLFCGIQYENMKASDVELLRNDWNDDSRHYLPDNRFSSNIRIFPYSSFRPIVVGHMMKHLAKTIEECKAETSPFTSVWKYANEVYDKNAHHREREKLNANKQKK